MKTGKSAVHLHGAICISKIIAKMNETMKKKTICMNRCRLTFPSFSIDNNKKLDKKNEKKKILKKFNKSIEIMTVYVHFMAQNK